MGLEFDFDCGNLPENYGRCRKRYNRACHRRARCRNMGVGEFKCVCREPYSGDGFECTGRNQCERDSGRDCDANAECVQDKNGKYGCKCNKGYEGNGQTCTNIRRRCRARYGRSCHQRARCYRAGTDEFECRCDDDYFGNGIRCRRKSACHRQEGKPCHPDANCRNVGGRNTCSCKVGYEGDGFQCRRVSRCQAKFKKPCDANADCGRVAGVVKCRCRRGYSGDGFTCSAVDRCRQRYNKRCGANSRCQEGSDGRHECACNDGYSGDGFTCRRKYPKDSCGARRAEIMAENIPDAFVPDCDNDGNYRRKQCYGFTGRCYCVNKRNGARLAGTEMDSEGFNLDCGKLPNTCKYRRAQAESEQMVGNFIPMCDDDGSYLLEQCHGSSGQCFCVEGVTGSEVEGTRAMGLEFDFDCGNLPENYGKCRKRYNRACHRRARCRNMGVGEFKCVCREPYSGDGFECTGQNQCERDSGRDCDANAECIQDKNGKYGCKCNRGYEGNGQTCTNIRRRCRARYGRSCHQRARCYRAGTDEFECRCDDDYFGNGIRCRRKSACHRQEGKPCHPDANCRNVGGRNTCSCKIGYQGDGFQCRRVSRCQAKFKKPCDANADCGRVAGVVKCRCRRGYSGDGFTCSAVDHCRQRYNKRCGANSRCQKGSDGGYECACNDGYSGDGFTCREIDHCYSESAQPCHHEAECIGNAVDGYNCRCKEGYQGDGKNCRVMGCHRPVDIANGRILSTQEMFSANNVISYQCDHGYYMNGLAQRTCQDDGQWSGSQPSCQVTPTDTHPDTTQPPRVEDGCYQQHAKFCSEYAACTNDGGNFRCECWGGYTGDGYDCQRQCQRPPDINQGRVKTPGGPFDMNDVIEYECNGGHSLIGNQQRTCQRNGQWSGNQPRCQKHDDCYRQDNRFCSQFANCINDGGSFRCQCYGGYSGDGYACDLDSARPSEAPGQKCQRPGGINQGRIQSEGGVFDFNAVIRYECNGGHTLIGDQQRTCQSNGQWSGSEPRCQAQDDCYRQHNRFCSQFATCINDGSFRCQCYGGYSGDGYTCDPDSTKPSEGRKCQRPGGINQGRILSEGGVFDPNAVITYQCNGGHTLIGNQQRTCQSNGQWSGSEPRCQAHDGCYRQNNRFCSQFATCVNDGGRYVCQCYGGYNGDGYSCNRLGQGGGEGQPGKGGGEGKPGQGGGEGEGGGRGGDGEGKPGKGGGEGEGGGGGKGGEGTPGQGGGEGTPGQGGGEGKPGDGGGKGRPGQGGGEGKPGQGGGEGTPGQGGGEGKPGDGGGEGRPGQGGGEGKPGQGGGEGQPGEGGGKGGEGGRGDGGGEGQTGQAQLTMRDCFEHTRRQCNANAECRRGKDGQPTCVCRGGYSGNGYSCDRTCSRLNNIGNGQVNPFQEEYFERDTVTYKCDPGFYLHGNEQRTCQSNGQWSGSEPTCQSQPPQPGQGGQPPQPGQGGQSQQDGQSGQDDQGDQPGQGGQPGQTDVHPPQPTQPTQKDCFDQLGKRCHANAECRTGDGGLQCVCVGGYSGDGYNCQRTCQRPSDITLGRITTSAGEFYPGDSITYECNPGYTLNGNAQRTCQSNGQWSGSEPTCQAGCGPSPCPECTKCNKNSGKCECIPGCNKGQCAKKDPPKTRERRCQMPSNIAQGQVSTNNNDLTAGTTATYTCNQGYRLVGNSQRTCQPDGSWSGTTPNCQKDESGDKRCQPPPNIEQGRVSVSNSELRPGTTATYSCNQGYRLNGNSQRTCQADGSWSGSSPRCDRDDGGSTRNCPNLPNIGQGQMTTSNSQLTPGTTATYRCNQGYILRGDSQRTCQDGSWSGSQPRCEQDATCSPSPCPRCKKCNANTGQCECIPGCESRQCRGKPTASTTRCPQPPNVAQAQVSTSNSQLTPGTTATYSCNQGYVRRGGSQLTCQSSGSWSGVRPRCRRARG